MIKPVFTKMHQPDFVITFVAISQGIFGIYYHNYSKRTKVYLYLKKLLTDDLKYDTIKAVKSI